jgi:hypothetical protein
MDHPCLKCGTSMVVDQNSPAGYPLDLVCSKCCTSCVIASGAPELTISEAAATLGVRFPPSYRTFLAQYGAGFWKGGLLEIVGLFHQPDISVPLTGKTSSRGISDDAEAPRPSAALCRDQSRRYGRHFALTLARWSSRAALQFSALNGILLWSLLTSTLSSLLV